MGTKGRKNVKTTSYSSWAENFPRLYELYRNSDQENEANYFASFDEVLKNPLAQSHYERLEEELTQLSDVAWQEFKQKVLRYVTIRDSLRGYNQLFECFNEVKGYLYLKSEGYKEIHFIPKEDSKTPDLRACCGSSIVLLEVKTINTSADEIKWIRENSEIGADGVRHMEAREVRQGLNQGLNDKITKAVEEAREQLLSHACEGVEHRIVYLVIHLDRLLALDSSNLIKLAAYIGKQGDEQIEVKHCCDW